MACEAERTALANAAAEWALSLATEAIAYADYITSMMATYAAFANYLNAMNALSACENGQRMQNHDGSTEVADRVDERMDCVTHGMNILAKIDEYGGPKSKELTEARDKLRHAIQQAI
jgi:hypothetical protein